MFQQPTQKLEEFIKEKDINPRHWLRTGYWIKEIYPEADEIMYISAICHDIERAFPLRDGEVKPEIKNWDDPEYNLWHQNRSAEFAEKVLRDFGFNDDEKIYKIKDLIKHHEVGGNEEMNMLKDADSLSFLENNIEMFVASIPEKHSKEEIGKKFDFMYNRISSPKAKELAKPFYEEAIKKLK